MTWEAMTETVRELTAAGKGILAADESTGTISKRLKAVGIDSNETVRRDYRELLFSTPDLGNSISGVILYDETLRQQASTGAPLVRVLVDQGIVPGIKVDRGTVGLPRFPDEKFTQGLDDLTDRLREYRQLGARFAKWRAVISIGPGRPSAQCIAANAEGLARYAALCQQEGIVPIVEPEVLMDGPHDIETCASVTENVQHQVFDALHRYRVIFECMILKPNMALPGKDSGQTNSPEEVAEATLRGLRRVVPAAVPSINFLSGGQDAAMATVNLNALNAASGPKPWQLSFSYARALQSDAMALWHGEAAKRGDAQRSFSERAALVSLARKGEYRAEMEPSA